MKTCMNAVYQFERMCEIVSAVAGSDKHSKVTGDIAQGLLDRGCNIPRNEYEYECLCEKIVGINEIEFA